MVRAVIAALVIAFSASMSQLLPIGGKRYRVGHYLCMFFKKNRLFSPSHKWNRDITPAGAQLFFLPHSSKYLKYTATLIGIIALFGIAIGRINLRFVWGIGLTLKTSIGSVPGTVSKIVKQQILSNAVATGLIVTLGCAGLGTLIGNIVLLLTKHRILYLGHGYYLAFPCALLFAGRSDAFIAGKTTRIGQIGMLNY